MTKEDFKRWYYDPIRELCKSNHNGFIILIATFPILERYLRDKFNIKDNDDITNEAVKYLFNMFELKQKKKARDFWSQFRNGLFHNAVFKEQGVINWNVSDIVIDDGKFHVNPKDFANKVLDEIDENYNFIDASHLYNDATQSVSEPNITESIKR